MTSSCDEVGSGVLDPDDEDRTFYRQVMGAVAELDRAKTLRRLNAGRTAKRERDGWAGGMVPYGYRTVKIGERKLLEPNPDEQRAIRDARRMRSNGKSWRDVCAFLNRRMGGELLTPPRRGREWHPMSVKRIVERSTP